MTKQEAIIPRKTILELQRLLGDVDDPVKIDIAANQARFSFSGIELISKLIEGKFPDFNRVIPSFYTSLTQRVSTSFYLDLGEISGSAFGV